MRTKLSKKQVELMKILWDSPTPLIASDIVKLNPALNINTVQACLRTLVNDKAVKVADIVYSGTVLTRSYSPVLSKEEYLSETYKDINGTSSSSSILASLIESETSLAELEKLEKLIAKKKAVIKEG